MPWDGSGNFELTHDFSADRDAGPPASQISADKMMDVLQDIAVGLMLTLQRGAQNTPTADMRWGNYRLRNLARGSLPTDAITADQVAEDLITYAGMSGGSAAAITATNSFITEVSVGTTIRATALNTNADNATFSAGGVTAAIIEKDGSNIKANRIVSGKRFACSYDGTYWVLVETGNKLFDASIAALNALAQLVPAADNMPYFTGATTAGLTALTSYARSLLAAVDVAHAQTILGFFDPGTAMSFFQSTAPTGWTKSTAHNDKIPRIVSGAASSGGSTPFSTVFAPRTLPQSSLPNVTLSFSGTTSVGGAHAHVYQVPQGNVNNGFNYGAGGKNSSAWTDTQGDHAHTYSGNTSSVNGGVTQTTIDFAVQYVDMIIATKN